MLCTRWTLSASLTFALVAVISGCPTTGSGADGENSNTNANENGGNDNGMNDGGGNGNDSTTTEIRIQTATPTAHLRPPATSPMARPGTRTTRRRRWTRSRMTCSSGSPTTAGSGSGVCRLTFPSKYWKRMPANRCAISNRPTTGSIRIVISTPCRSRKAGRSKGNPVTSARPTATAT